MKIEIMLDMEAIGEDDTILVQDEFGEYPDCEYVPKSAYDRIEAENAKLRKLVAHLMFVKPNDVSAILYEGELLRFEDLLAEVGMRWVSEAEE